MNTLSTYRAASYILLALLLTLVCSPVAWTLPTLPDYLERSQRDGQSTEYLLRSGQFLQAKQEIIKQLQQQPNTPGLLVALGYAEAGLKNWSAAMEAMQQASALVPPAARVLLQIDVGNIYALQEKYAQAEQRYSAVLMQDPQNVRALYSLGLLAAHAGKKDTALEHYQRVLQLDPRHEQASKALIAIYLQEQRYAEALPLARQLQHNVPTNGSGYLLEALALMRQDPRNAHEALPLLKQAIAKDPLNGQARYLLAVMLVQEKQFDEAIPHLQQAVRIDPSLLEAHKLLVSLALQQNDPKAAAEYVENVLSVQESPQMYRLLGELRLRLGQPKAAAEALTKSLQGASLGEGEVLATEGLVAYLNGDQATVERKLSGALKKNPTLYDTRVLLIVERLEQKKYAEAKKLIDEGRTLHPQEQHSWSLLLSSAQVGEGKADEAVQTLQEVISKDPTYTAAQFSLAQVYFRQNEYQKAEATLRQLLITDPKNVSATLILSRIYEATNQLEKATTLLQDRLANEPTQLALRQEKIRMLLKMNRFAQALEDADAVVAANPEAFLGNLLKARIYGAQGDMVRAFAAIDTILDKSPENQAALVLGAVLAFDQEQYVKSQEYLARYVSAHKTLPAALRKVYAGNLIETGKVQEARTYMQKELPQTDASTLYLYGLSWIKDKDFSRAEKYLDQATQNDSGSEKALYDLAKVKVTLGKAADAQVLFNKLIALNPRNPRYYIALATLHQGAKELDDAIAVYERGLANQANPVVLLNNLVILATQKNDPTAAATYAQRVLELAPNDANVLDTVGWMYMQTKRHGTGLAYLERATSQSPDVLLFRYHLGMGYYEAGKLDEARLELEKVLAHGERTPWAAQARTVLAKIAGR